MELIGFINPKIEHIGSTSVEGLSTKPIIDILIGLNNESDLEKTITPLTNNDYVYYERYNKDMPISSIKERVHHSNKIGWIAVYLGCREEPIGDRLEPNRKTPISPHFAVPFIVP